jgi:predicted enzyme related to lactoylglutathione lyase
VVKQHRAAPGYWLGAALCICRGEFQVLRPRFYRERHMSPSLRSVPKGNRQHPITMVAIAAIGFAASRAFYHGVFDWPPMSLSDELASGTPPAGPTVTARAKTPDGFRGVVPFIAVRNVDEALSAVVQAGGAVERYIPFRVPDAS